MTEALMQWSSGPYLKVGIISRAISTRDDDHIVNGVHPLDVRVIRLIRLISDGGR
jgi:hypothetical protein